MTLTLFFVIALALNLFISSEVSKVAQTRELGGEKGFWISFLLSPIVGLLFVLASPALTKEQVNQIKNQVVITTPEQEALEEKQQNQIAAVLVTVMFVIALVWSFNN